MNIPDVISIKTVPDQDLAEEYERLRTRPWTPHTFNLSHEMECRVKKHFGVMKIGSVQYGIDVAMDELTRRPIEPQRRKISTDDTTRIYSTRHVPKSSAPHLIGIDTQETPT